MRWVASLCVIFVGAGCASSRPPVAFEALSDGYVRGFLARYPVVSTYLGGGGLDPALAELDGELRDVSPEAFAREDQWLEQVDADWAALDEQKLTAPQRIDRRVARAQIAFLLRAHRVRHQQERALDTYVEEPFRGLDFQIQGLTDTHGTPEEWARVTKRVAKIPRFLEQAAAQLEVGLASDRAPDPRMILRDGFGPIADNARYFEHTLIETAQSRGVSGAPLDALKGAGKEAADAYRRFGKRLAQMYGEAGTSTTTVKASLRGDRYALGEPEYDWALKNNLRVDTPARKLFEDSWPIVQATQQEMLALCRQIAAKRGIAKLPDDPAGAFEILDAALSADHPATDAEMLAGYREAGARMVAYARKTGLFDVSADEKLDVMETPEPLRGGGPGAAYYPAPPFKGTGVGRFYVNPTGNDPSQLSSIARASYATLAAHEGFPGHDWNFKVMTMYKKDISALRWLTPGAVEDSSSMWQDSVATEGWGLYAEQLMAEPQPGAPEGFYSPEERLYQLESRLFRELRVRVDIGMHIGALSFDEAAAVWSQVMHGQPGGCSPKDLEKASDAKKKSCRRASSSMYRYSKWPTQAITYRLGKDMLVELRKKAEKAPGFSAKKFHMDFMRQGSIPPGYFADQLVTDTSR